MHSTTGITDQFYLNMNDEEKKNRIDSMFDRKIQHEKVSDEYKEFLEFQAWKKAKRQ